MRKTTILLILVFLAFCPNCKDSDESGVAEIVLKEKSEPPNVKLVFEKKVKVPDMLYPSLHKADENFYLEKWKVIE